MLTGRLPHQHEGVHDAALVWSRAGPAPTGWSVRLSRVWPAPTAWLGCFSWVWPAPTKPCCTSGPRPRPTSRGTDASLQVDLLRHGEVVGGSHFRGHTDDPLTATGMAQMHATITDSGGWDKVISSPLVRCAAFAEEYARRYSTPLSFDARLMEIHFGDWEGRTAAELMTTDADALTRFWNDPLHNTPPGGEPLTQFQARVLDAWNDIVIEHPGQRVLVVTHGGVIRALLCHVLEQPLAQLQAFEVKHGGLYRVRVDGDGRSTYAGMARSYKTAPFP